MRTFRRLLLCCCLLVSAGTFAAASYEQALPSVTPTTAQPDQTTVPASSTSNTLAPESSYQTSTPTTTTQAAMPAGSQVAVLMSKVMQLNQQLMGYQQNMNQQLSSQRTANQQSENQISQLAGVMKTFGQQIQALQSQNQQFLAAQSAVSQQSWVQKIQSQLGVWPFYLIFGLIILALVMLAVWCWPKKSRGEATIKTPEMASGKADYDFMTTKEAMPAKLDLARAYVAMDDAASASKVLEEIQQHGNAAQKKEALSLLEKIQPKSVADGNN